MFGRRVIGLSSAQGAAASSSLKDVTLWAVTGGALAFLALVIYVLPLARLFHFAALGLVDVALCFGAAALSITWFEILKWRGRGRVTTSTKPGQTVAQAGAA